MHTGQPGFQCVEARRLEARVTFAEAVAGTRQFNRVFAITREQIFPTNSSED